MGARPSSFARVTEPPKPTRVWSAQQQAIFDWFYTPMGERRIGEVASTPNLVVRARAGAAKTTTILEGVNRAPEARILLCAFNKSIAEELATRIDNPNAEVKTLHALGFQMIRREWRGIPVAEGSLRADFLTDLVLRPWEDAHQEKVPFQIRRLISHLHTKAREMIPMNPDEAALTHLAFRFDYIPDEGWNQFDLDFVVLHALAAVHHAVTEPPTYDIGIDYADMIFLPLVHNLTSRDWQLVVVDEAQDMTVAQLEIAQRVCDGRICIVGDDRQAVYGFRGADSSSLDRLKTELNAIELSLTTTYRCGTAIVEHAQRLVPDIVAWDQSPVGSVEDASYAALKNTQPGDFVLSRLNAPLVGVTLAFLRQNKRARMAGRDIGKSVADVLKKLRISPTTPIEDAIDRIAQWERKTVTRLAAHGQLDLIARTRDQAGVLYALAEDAETCGDLIRQCDFLFTDAQDGDQILCSSVHKAKGLEADTVYVLQDTFYTRGRSLEEDNLLYVAVTRAKSRLILVRQNVA